LKKAGLEGKTPKGKFATEYGVRNELLNEKVVEIKK